MPQRPRQHSDICFTLELAVRVGATANLHLLVSDPFLYADVLAIIPFFLFILTCVVEQSFEKPGRTSTDRMESLQVLKLVRILKLARHFEGARVLWLALQVITPPPIPRRAHLCGARPLTP